MSITPQTNSNIYDASLSGKIRSDEFEEKLANEFKESIGEEFLKSLIKEIELKEDGWYFERLEVPDDKDKEIRGKFVNLNKVEYMQMNIPTSIIFYLKIIIDYNSISKIEKKLLSI